MIASVLATFWGKVLVLEQDENKNLVLSQDDPIFEGQRDRLVGFGTTPIPPHQRVASAMGSTFLLQSPVRRVI
jgi:hypothetical protein